MIDFDGQLQHVYCIQCGLGWEAFITKENRDEVPICGECERNKYEGAQYDWEIGAYILDYNGGR